MFRKILLAVDGSPDAEEATRYARDIAQHENAQVVVVHAFEPVSDVWGEPQGSEIIAERTSKGREIAGKAVEKLETAQVENIVELLEGPPAEAILKVAEVRKPDLILMGSRGLGNLKGLLLGSVSHRVLANAQVPVMVVKARKGEGQ